MKETAGNPDLPPGAPSADYLQMARDLHDAAGELACAIGTRHYRTDNELRMFLALAGTVLLGDRSAIQRFENTFTLESAIDGVISYLQAELEMLDGGFPGE